MWKRSLFKPFCVLLATLCIFVSASSCADNKKAGSDSGPASFTDALGREIHINAKPEKAAALLGSFADLWLLAGGQLCATVDDAAEDFGIDTENLTLLGGAHSPSFELLLASDPDLVLASSSTASHVEMRDGLEQAGITVAYFDVNSFDDYLSMLKICTDLTEKTENYEKNGIAIAERIDQIKKEFQVQSSADQELTVLVLRVSSGLVKAKSSEGTVLGEMLKDLGCTNLADKNRSLTENLSIEYILEQNPRHILVVTMGDEEKAKSNFYTMMEENPAWSSLDAVKEGRMHILDKSLFNQKPNARWAIAYETLASLLEE